MLFCSAASSTTEQYERQLCGQDPTNKKRWRLKEPGKKIGMIYCS